MKEQGQAPGPGVSNIEVQSIIADLERQLAEAKAEIKALKEDVAVSGPRWVTEKEVDHILKEGE